MADTIDLEISIFGFDREHYRVELRFQNPDDSSMPAPVNGLLNLDPSDLDQYHLDPAGYGQALSQALFADAIVLARFQEGRAVAAQQSKMLRIRLFIDRSAEALYPLRWETLVDPIGKTWLLSDERTPFSRFLSNSSWESLQLKARDSLRALAVIANPSDLADGVYEVDGETLAPLQVDRELEIVHTGLKDISIKTLASDPLQPGQASLGRMLGEIRLGCDILYLVCHGAYLTEVEAPGPYLWLEGQDGKAVVESGAALAEAIQKLTAERRPCLVVLASCQSAGDGSAAGVESNRIALTTLGALLVEAGVPAVLAMQGNISLETIDAFMPVFFQELSSHGLIDRAVAVARSQVSARPDAWMPLLWMRLRDGRLWLRYTPGFTGDRPGFDRWPGFMKSLQQQICTPILGPGMSEFLLGASRQIARRWAEENAYPLADESMENLPQVAQYLANVQGTSYYPRDRLVETLDQNVRQQFEPLLPPEVTGSELPRLIELAGQQLWREQSEQAHWILARLPLPIYITTNPDNLLEAALRAAGKEPVVDFCRWHPELEKGLSPLGGDYYPAVDQPLVYHLFGVLETAASLVVSEDDYFDYLMWVKPPNSIPTVVDQALGSNALLFLGFEVYEWNFRVVFRSILDEKRRSYRRHYPSVAVQVTPSKQSTDPQRVRAYLEQFFLGVQMGVFLGTADDFTREMWRRWQVGGAR